MVTYAGLIVITGVVILYSEFRQALLPEINQAAPRLPAGPIKQTSLGVHRRSGPARGLSAVPRIFLGQDARVEISQFDTAAASHIASVVSG